MPLEPKDVRELYSDFMNEWREVREEGAIDVRYLAGDPWTPKDRREREDAGRPCISLDELNQYLNQYNNSLRQNKRGIQVIPKGDGANDKDATTRENIIRGIEYESNAQEAYITAAECAASRGYGFALLRTEYKDDTSFDQKITIQRVGNPDLILITPYFERADASDINEAFILRRIMKSEFKSKFPDAEKVSFTNEDMTLAPQWIGEKWLQIAEFWKIYYSKRKLLLVDVGGSTVPVWEDDIEEFAGRKNIKKDVKRERSVDIPEVKQQMTNGIEMLGEPNDWAGTRIPIISCFGKELWVTEGADVKRQLLSMVRLARDPQMLFAYLCTKQAEEAGMTPLAPFIGYTGQFEKARADWEVVNKQPVAFLEVDAMNDQNKGEALPLPTRPQYQPNFQAYEIAKESVRRSIMAAMGLTPLPTAAQRQNEKSGIALERIETQQSVGSFHFADNFERFLQNLGWQVNQLIKPIFDTPREVMGVSADDEYEVINVVGDTSHPDEEGGEEPPDGSFHTGRGNFDVTISTAPFHQSQREAQQDFVDVLITNMATLPPPNTPQAKVFALGIRMRNDLGPVAKQIADVFDPPDPSNLPPEAQAVVQQLQSQIQQLTQENAALHEDRAGRVLEQQTKMMIANMKEQGDNLRAQLAADLKAYIANVQTKAQDESERRTLFQETQQENQHKVMDHAHEVAMQKDQQEHEHAIADKNALAASTSQAMDQAHQSATQATEIANRPQPEPENSTQ